MVFGKSSKLYRIRQRLRNALQIRNQNYDEPNRVLFGRRSRSRQFIPGNNAKNLCSIQGQTFRGPVTFAVHSGQDSL